MYEWTLRDVERTKEFYKKNKGYEKWKEMLRLAVPHTIDDDLLEVLETGLPEDSTPSALALEQTARLMKIPPNTYTTRTKQGLLKRSRIFHGQINQD